MRSLLPVSIALATLAAGPAEAAGPVPTRVGQCVASRIAQIGFRLGTPGSGSALSLANGIPGISYDTIPGIEGSRPGDPVMVCLVSLPSGCPRGDTRGKIYQMTNRRTGASWRLPDSEHACGGA